MRKQIYVTAGGVREPLLLAKLVLYPIEPVSFVLVQVSVGTGVGVGADAVVGAGNVCRCRRWACRAGLANVDAAADAGDAGASINAAVSVDVVAPRWKRL